MSGALPADTVSPTVGIGSGGLWRLVDDIGRLLSARPVWLGRLALGEADLFAGWGHKPTARRVRARAAALGRPYIAVEEGFIAYPTPLPGPRPLAYAVDRGGIYYDAESGSDLFALLRDTTWITPDLHARAVAILGLIRRLRLSKYNGARTPPDAPPLPRAKILVVDQTAGDASIALGRASAATFETMIETALRAHAAGDVAVKLHPQTLSGVKGGHLGPVAEKFGLPVIADDRNPWDLFDAFPEIWTVSSQIGFEALLAGRRVRCFGAPFYAGWGLTEDEIRLPDRRAGLSVVDLVAALFLRYLVFLDAFTRLPIPFEQAAEQISDLARRHAEFADPCAVAGFSGWKRARAAEFLAGGRKRPVFYFSQKAAERRAEAEGRDLVVWASKRPPGRPRPKISGRVLLVEDGFLRSVGLGAAHVPPLSLVFDDLGIYYDPRAPSRLEEILSRTDFSPELVARAARLRERIVAGAITKYLLPNASPPLPRRSGRRTFLVPGQVEDDRSVELGGGGIRTNLDLLASVRRANPGATILYKPHPDVSAGFRRGWHKRRLLLRFADAIVDSPIPRLLDQVDEVHTLTSLVGFEALLRRRNVVVYGRPFYAGWGLTTDLAPLPRRGRRLELDELVAGALILYPRYVHPEAGFLCDPERAIDWLVAHRDAPVAAPWRLSSLPWFTAARLRHRARALIDR